ncbi:T9SS type A sorting domain-containing protein [bacterium]|nr:T9SS type A sorting domain-containing protein [bacterium]
MKKWICVFLIVLTSVCLSQTQFVSTIGGSGRDEGESVISLSDGSYAVTGRTFSFGAGSSDMIIAKFASDGSLEWAKAVGGEYQDNGSAVIQTRDDGLIVCGSSNNFGGGYTEFFLVKLNSSGTLEWAKTVISSYYEYSYTVLQTSDDGFLAGGYTSSHGAGGSELYLIKFSSTGSLEWAKTIGGTGDDNLADMVLTSDGGVAIIGYTQTYGAGGNDMLVIKLNSSYAIEWARVIGGAGEEYAQSLIQTSDDGYAIISYSNSFGAGGNDIVMAKLNGAGDMEWAVAVGGVEHEYGNGIAQSDHDGNYAVTGITTTFGEGGEEGFLVKLSEEGDLESAFSFGSYGSDYGASIAPTLDNGFVVTGILGFISNDICLAKFNSTGNTCLGEEVSPAILVVTESLVVESVSPMVESVTASAGDAAPIVTEVTGADTLLCSNLGIHDDAPLPHEFEITAYPNPFNSTISISSPINADVRIYDVLGKLITRLRGGETVWQPKPSVESGIFLLRVEFGESVITKRVVYLK